MDLIGHKAGFKGVDREQLKKTIEELSKGSKFYKNEKRKGKITEARVQKMKEMRRKLESEGKIYPNVRIAEIESLIVELEAKRDLTRYILSVDMDAFFVSVELKYQPELRGKPVAVGGMAMLSTSSYEAREYGVRAGMPGFIAQRFCPDIIFVGSHFEYYKKEAETVRIVISKYNEEYTTGSLDEAMLDITEYMERNNMTAQEVGTQLKNEIKEATDGLTASCGIGANRMLAKICSDINKPDGVFVLPNNRDDIIEFIEELPCRAVPGIGKVTEKILKGLEIEKCADLYENKAALFYLFSPISFRQLIGISLGIASGYNSENRNVRSRSIGAERTFHATNELDLLYSKLEQISSKVSTRCDFEKENPRVVTLKAKTEDFRVFNKSFSLPRGEILCGERMTEISKFLLSNLLLEKNDPKIRLMGVRLGRLESEEKKKSLADERQKSITAYLTHGNNNANDESAVALEEEGGGDGSDADDSGDEEQLDDIFDSYGECSLTQEEVEIASQAILEEEDGQEGDDLEKKSGFNEEISEVECPVCHEVFYNIYSIEMHRHIDKCLLKAREKPVSKERTSLPVTASKRKTGSQEKRSEKSVRGRKKRKKSIKDFFNVIEDYRV